MPDGCPSFLACDRSGMLQVGSPPLGKTIVGFFSSFAIWLLPFLPHFADYGFWSLFEKRMEERKEEAGKLCFSCYCRVALFSGSSKCLKLNFSHQQLPCCGLYTFLLLKIKIFPQPPSTWWFTCRLFLLSASCPSRKPLGDLCQLLWFALAQDLHLLFGFHTCTSYRTKSGSTGPIYMLQKSLWLAFLKLELTSSHVLYCPDRRQRPALCLLYCKEQTSLLLVMPLSELQDSLDNLTISELEFHLERR